MRPYRTDDQGLWISVRLQPKASRTQLGEFKEGAWQLKVMSPPVDGAANKEAIKFLSKTFKCPKTQIHLEKGEKSRDKLFRLETFKEEQLSLLGS